MLLTQQSSIEEDSFSKPKIRIRKHENIEIGFQIIDNPREVQDLQIKIQSVSPWLQNQFKEHIDQLKIFKNITSLQIEIIKQSKFEGEEVRYLGQWLFYFNCLESISLRIFPENQSCAQSCKQILQGLEWLPNLKKFQLIIDENNIGSQAVQEIADSITKIKKLNDLTLVIQENEVDKIGAQAIGIALYKLINLKSLSLVIGIENNIGQGPDRNFSFDNLCDNFKDIFSTYLKKTRQDLKMVDKHHDPSKTHGIHSIARSFQNLQSLENLHLIIDNDNNLNVLGCERLGEGLSHLKNLKQLKLVLGNNQILSNGIESICRNLIKLQNLIKLDLTVKYLNQILSTGAISIGKALAELTNLTHLTINIDSRNNIGDDGAVGIGEGLKFLVNLIELRIIISWKNYILIRGCLGLANGLLYLQKLQILDLQIDNTNNIQEQGSEALGQSLNNLRQLRQINLQYEQPIVNKKIIYRKNVRLITLKTQEQ